MQHASENGIKALFFYTMKRIKLASSMRFSVTMFLSLRVSVLPLNMRHVVLLFPEELNRVNPLSAAGLVIRALP